MGDAEEKKEAKASYLSDLSEAERQALLDEALKVVERKVFEGALKRTTRWFTLFVAFVAILVGVAGWVAVDSLKEAAVRRASDQLVNQQDLRAKVLAAAESNISSQIQVGATAVNKANALTADIDTARKNIEAAGARFREQEAAIAAGLLSNVESIHAMISDIKGILKRVEENEQ